MPEFFTLVWPFLNLQPGLYWAAEQQSDGGQATFSFNTGLSGSKTIKYNFFHVLAMTSSVLGPIPPGQGVVPYRSGPAASKAVYDTGTGLSWLLNANLPADDNFHVAATTTVTSNVNDNTLTARVVDEDGTVYFSAVDPANTDPKSSWIAALNQSEFGGASTWSLPRLKDLKQLYQDMTIEAGDPRLEFWGFEGPFFHLQPGFYWSCERADATKAKAPCDPGLFPGYAADGVTEMRYSFNFDDGFEGTDLPNKQFYVMVYYRAPAAQ